MSKIIEYIHLEQCDSFVLYAEEKEFEIPTTGIESWFRENGYFNWSHSVYFQEINDVEQTEGQYKNLTEYLYHNPPKIVLQDLNKFFAANCMVTA